MEDMKIAEITKEYRTAHRMSLRKFAEKCGCSFQYLSKLEQGAISNPSLDMVMKLSHGMDIPVSHLLLIADDADKVVVNDKPKQQPVLRIFAVQVVVQSVEILAVLIVLGNACHQHSNDCLILVQCFFEMVVVCQCDCDGLRFLCHN